MVNLGYQLGGMWNLIGDRPLGGVIWYLEEVTEGKPLLLSGWKLPVQPRCEEVRSLLTCLHFLLVSASTPLWLPPPPLSLDDTGIQLLFSNKDQQLSRTLQAFSAFQNCAGS